MADGEFSLEQEVELIKIAKTLIAAGTAAEKSRVKNSAGLTPFTSSIGDQTQVVRGVKICR